jgi:outer membrane protein
MNPLRSQLMVSFGLVGMVGLPVVHAQISLDNMQQSLMHSDFAEAYSIGKGLLETSEGDADFDLAYGRAALRAGHANEAVFALERAIVARPGDQDIRLDLVEAYLAIGNQQAARDELEQANQQGLTGQQANRARGLAAQLGGLPIAAANPWRGDIGLSLGYDTNVNNATATDELILPGLAGITVEQTVDQLEDGFAQLKLRLDRSMAVGDENRANFALDAYHRLHADEGDYDLTDVNLSAALTGEVDGKTYVVQGRLRPTWRDGELYRAIYGLGTELGLAGTGLTDYSLGLAWNYFDYEDNNLLDRQQLLASAGLTHKAAPLVHQVMAYGGTEWADQAAGKYNARDLLGISYRLIHAASNEHRSFAQVFYQQADHKAHDPLYAKDRKDDLVGVSLGHDWRITPKITLFGRYHFYDNASNLALYEYDRHFFQTGFRYRF